VEEIGLIIVRDLMDEDFPMVDKDETLYQSVRVMEKYSYDRVVVFDKKKLVGVVTKKDIMYKLGQKRTSRTTPGRLHVSSFIRNTPPITISPDTLVVKACRVMIENNISSLPVVEDENVVGLFHKKSILPILKEISVVPARRVMFATPYVAKVQDTAMHIRQILLSENIDFLPVVDEDGRPVGLISVDEIAEALFVFHDIVPLKHRKERKYRILVEDIMKMRPPIVGPDTTISEIASLIEKKNTRGVVVVDADRVIGLVSLTNLTEFIAREYVV